MPQLASMLNVTAVDLGISANGRYDLYVSSEISTTNNQAIDATLMIHEWLPNRQNAGRSKMMFLMERKDDAGNWHPLHTMFNALSAIEFDSSENGGIIPDQQLSYGPNIYNPDAVNFDSSDGENIILQDYPKRGVLPDKIRFKIWMHEIDFGLPQAFGNFKFSLDYELRAE